jgi:hypothetical protein
VKKICDSSIPYKLFDCYNSFSRDPAEPAPPAALPSKSSDEPMLYCPVCSLRLTERKCKLFCQKCGYYMSCADYY